MSPHWNEQGKEEMSQKSNRGNGKAACDGLFGAWARRGMTPGDVGLAGGSERRVGGRKYMLVGPIWLLW